MDNQGFNTTIKSLGHTKYQSPLKYVKFIDDNMRMLDQISIQHYNQCVQSGRTPVSFELAGPRERIYFDPEKTVSAIVTCGGLCPGLNNVIRSLVMQLYYQYGVKEIIGFLYGYEGLVASGSDGYINLTPSVVSDIHVIGGSILSSSRGPQDVLHMIDTLERLRIDILFAIGGDGTLRGAHDLVKEIEEKGAHISIIGIPKTIDNDISFTSRSFGFETAFSSAVQAIQSAHTEAEGAPNGIGLVKLMGRYSGFIAANASMAQTDVNFCLVPEVDFDLEGEEGLFNQLRMRLIAKKHAVIVVAEGAGQKFFDPDKLGRDPSGNQILGDIGIYLKQRITQYFKGIKMPINLKYIDPSYIIRSVPAIPSERVFCGLLAQNAVHAAMAGKTDMIIGLRNNQFIHVPIETAIKERKRINPKGSLWQSLLASTGQPRLINKVERKK